MQRKTFNHTLLVLATAALVAPLAAHAQAVKLTLGHGAAPGNPRHEASVKFAEVAKAQSGGRIEVTVAPSAQLGDDAAMVTALRTGALDLSANSQGAVSSAVPEYAAFGMPFLFSTPADAFKLLDGPLGKELADKSLAKGMVVLGYWDNGIRHMSNGKHPITKVEDMKGLKMRTPPDAVLVDIMQALGADAQQIKFAELYVALQQGVVDGQENPLVNFHASKLLDDLKAKGVQVTTVDKAAFAKATAGVDAKWRAGPIGTYVGKVIAAARTN
jgi:tripartite ATP-independent transporter DctP family solute receptor